MKIHELKGELDELQFITSMNQRYHQGLEAWWGYCDRGLKIGVGSAAVVGLVFSVANLYAPSVVLGFLGVILAVALNVVPTSDFVKQYGEKFRQWTDLRNDVDGLRLSVQNGDDGEVPDYWQLRLRELVAKRHGIEATEVAPDPARLKKAYEDENQSRYNVRSYEEAQKVRDAQKAAVAS